MAKSTRHHVFEGMELLPGALAPFVEKRLESALTGHWQVEVMDRVSGVKASGGKINWDQQALLKAMMAFWKEAFSNVLGHPERSYVSELLEVRNRLSHNETFTYDDAERALDTMRRLMESISAGDTAEQIAIMRDTILRTKYSELQRNEERRKSQKLSISVETVAGLLPWREVIEPHNDVATGRIQASGIRRRSWQGPYRQCASGVSRAERILQPHLPHRWFEQPVDRSRQAAGRPGAAIQS